MNGFWPLGRLIHIAKPKKWVFVCDCGKEVHALAASVKRGQTKSCGCYHREKLSLRRKSHGLSKSREFRIWAGIFSRCTNPNATGYKNYGGRGIKVCEQWRSFERFLADMGFPKAGESIDRKNNDGDYSPENCRWATKLEQTSNKRNNTTVTIGSETHHMAEWARITGMSLSTIYARLKRGLSHENAIISPLRCSDRSLNPVYIVT